MTALNTPGNLQTPGRDYIDPIHPDPADLSEVHMAHQLSLKCRWSGITNDLTDACEPVFYSVAQHSCHVHDLVAAHYRKIMPMIDWDDLPKPAFYAQAHDGSEHLLDDIARPLKPLLTNYYEIERNLMGQIITKWDIPYNDVIVECVKRIDNAILFWERDALCGIPITPYLVEREHPGGSIYDAIPNFEPWTPSRAKREFLARWRLHTQTRLVFSADEFDRFLSQSALKALGHPANDMSAHFDFAKVA